MKNNLIYALLGSLSLSLLGSCQTQKEATQAAFGSCATTDKTVQTVADVAGTLYLDQPTQQYKIVAAQPGTVDVVAVGLVCGPLPAAWQAPGRDGRKVVFSGTYKEYSPAPSAPAGYTYYHLELSQLKAQ